MFVQAPELFSGVSKYGPEVDVYSFGIILWELATRELPWHEIPATEYIVFYAELSRALESGRRPMIPAALFVAHPDYVAVMQECWSTEPLERPPFDDIVDTLAKL